MLRVYLIRHPDAKTLGEMQDQHSHKKLKDRVQDADRSLTKRGLNQRDQTIEALIDDLRKNRPPGKHRKIMIFCSPAIRCSGFAFDIEQRFLEEALLGEGWKVPEKRIEYDTLPEIGRGKYEGKSRQQREDEHPEEARAFHAARRDPATALDVEFPGPPRGENLKRVIARAREFKDDCRKRCGDDVDIIIVGHEYSLCALRSLLVGEKPSALNFITGAPCSSYGSIYLFEGDNWKTLQDKGYIHGHQMTGTPEYDRLLERERRKHLPQWELDQEEMYRAHPEWFDPPEGEVPPGQQEATLREHPDEGEAAPGQSGAVARLRKPPQVDRPGVPPRPKGGGLGQMNK